MKIVFQINYHTVTGQSLRLKLATVFEDTGIRLEQVIPMRWINSNQWQAEIQMNGAGRMRLEYRHQLRQDHNGVELDEWNGPRRVETDSATHDTLVLCDDWCSAGTVDYAFETTALQTVIPAAKEYSQAPSAPQANHRFKLRMAAVPNGHVPCLLGGAPGLGDWGWHHALQMTEIAPGLWQVDTRLPDDWRIDYKYGLYNLKLACCVLLEQGDNRRLGERGFGERQQTLVSNEAFRRDTSQLFHGAGVAVPVFSLRSEHSCGVGEFADLKPLADWSAEVGLKMIQILPINDTTSSHDWTDSYPYSAISVFALHPIYLRIEDLGHAMSAAFSADLAAQRKRLNALDQVDYPEVMKTKLRLTRAVFDKHHKKITTSAGFGDFLTENRDWVVPYAAFCVKRDEYGTADFGKWGDWANFSPEKCDALATPGHALWPDVAYHIWLQYELDRQLSAAAAHLHSRGIALKGDLPIGIDRQSVDAWSAPHLFKMDAQAGAPPDAFATKGQNWGFPTYNWEVMSADGYAWWRSRFAKLSRYFDAYRIDHILGFFRIWQIPFDQVEGIMGWFDPAIPVHVDDFLRRGIRFDYNRYCRPYIRAHSLDERFGPFVTDALRHYLDDCGYGYFKLRDHVATQRRISEHFATWDVSSPAVLERMECLRAALLDCASEVLFFEVPGSHGTLFHPRCSMHMTQSFKELDHDLKCRFDDLYVDYFYRRQESFWQARGLEKLPVMRQASPMLLCGEDLGMVPDCVPGVMSQLGILSLEIQRMPKSSKVEFSNPAHAPYMSVVSPSTHDMPTLRGWWREDAHATANFAWQMLGIAFPPLELPGDIATRIIEQHLHSPAMWAVFPLQDLLAMDEKLRHPDPDAERINVPAIMPYYWRYRMHLDVADLLKAVDFNQHLKRLLAHSRRAG